MQKPTFLKPPTFISGVAAMLLAATIFLSPAQARQRFSDNDAQSASSAAQQAPASSSAQDSSASAPAKTDAKKTPDAKPAAKTPAKEPAATTGSQADGATKTAGATKTGSAATTKTGQTAATKKAGASKTATAKTPVPLTLKTDKDKQSYAIGVNIGKGLGQDLKRNGLEIDPAILTRAIKDVLAGEKQSMTDQEAQDTLKALKDELGKEQQLKQEQLAATNKKEGDDFLAANKAKEGVTTLPDGLQYKILQEGTGPKPSATDAVTVNYRGTLVNGNEFDSSYKRGQPATFNLNGIIKGWTEALQLMPVGSKWQLVIPSDLAYGPSGRPPVIGPNSTLVFEVELVSVQPRPAPPAAPAPKLSGVPATSAPTGNPAPAANSPAPAQKPAPPAPKAPTP